MKKIVFSIAILFATPTFANEAAEWENLIACVKKHVKNVAQHIPSLEEGALLLTESVELCGNESTNLNNYLAKNREENLGGPLEWLQKYPKYTYVIKRDVKLMIYLEKIKRK